MRYVGAAAAGAAFAFLLAAVLLRERPTPAAAGRFPEQTAAFQQRSREEPKWNEKRGHAFSLKERDETAPDDDPRWSRILAGRPTRRPLPASCLACHASGPPASANYYEAAARKPLGCPDCHDPTTSLLRLTRTAPRAATSYDDLRTLVCAQCHHDYQATPWLNAETGAAVLDARHPQFEMYSRGIHARAGATCSDCHMPSRRSGALRVTEHNARSPRADLERACLPCHRTTPQEMKMRLEGIQARTTALLSRAEDAIVSAIDAIRAAQTAGAHVDAALDLETKAQWRAEFVAADRSKGFHAPQEAARLLAESIDYARQAEIAAARSLRNSRR
jgi:nitrite reductase (cytochrome c-552)